MLGKRGEAPASNRAESRKPKSLQGPRDAGVPRGSLRSFEAQSPPNTQTEAHHSIGLSLSRDYTSHQPWRREPHLGEGSAAVSAGKCSLFGLPSPRPSLTRGSGERGPEGASACPLPQSLILKLTGVSVLGGGGCLSIAGLPFILPLRTSQSLGLGVPVRELYCSGRICACLSLCPGSLPDTLSGL